MVCAKSEKDAFTFSDGIGLRILNPIPVYKERAS